MADGTSKHLDAAAPADIEVRKIVAGIKRRAKDHPNEPPARVLAASVGVLGEEVAMSMPERRNLIQNLCCCGHVKLWSLKSGHFGSGLSR